MPFALALRGTRARVGALVGAAFAVASFGVLFYWISYFGWLAWTGLVLTLAAYLAIGGALAARAWQRGSWWGVPAVALLFTGIELARERWPVGGFGWGSVGYTQIDGGLLLPLARIGGVHLVSLAAVAVAAAIAQVLASPREHIRERRLGAAVTLGAVLAAAFLPVGLAGVSGGTLDVVAVQGNVPRDRFTSLGRAGSRVGPEDLVIVRNHVEATESLVGGDTPDLVVWPESAFDRDPRGEAFIGVDGRGPIGDLVRRVGAPFVVNGVLDEGERWTNSNLLVGADGRIRDRYDKVHLVPFGEYVPIPVARELVPALAAEVPTDAIAGDGPRVFRLPSADVGTLICFESTYPQLARALAADGAEVLVVTTNNASYGTSPAAALHLQGSRMRAVETGRPVVHAAISGISAVIGPDGSVEQRTGLFQRAVLRAEVPLATAGTPFTRYGWGVEVSILLTAALLAAWLTLSPLVRRGATEGGGER